MQQFLCSNALSGLFLTFPQLARSTITFEQQLSTKVNHGRHHHGQPKHLSRRFPIPRTARLHRSSGIRRGWSLASAAEHVDDKSHSHPAAHCHCSSSRRPGACKTDQRHKSRQDARKMLQDVQAAVPRAAWSQAISWGE
jgi:hypothetical protein